MSTSTGIEWTDATWNPTTGCDRVSPGCDHCLGPDTPVLMADMSWRPIGKLTVGDEVVAFTDSRELGQNRVYERARVEHVWSTSAEAVEIIAGGRSVVASVDHRFLTHARPYWRIAERLALHMGIVDIGMPRWLPTVDSEPYLTGYLAGAITGDGTFRIAGSGRNDTAQSYLRIAVLGSDKPILDRALRAFAALGSTDISIKPFDGGKGGYDGALSRAQMLKIETRRRANLITIRDACLPERDDVNWKAGFLAGFFDTDGSYSGKNLRFAQTKDNGALDATHRYIHDLGFVSCREDFRSAKGRSERLVGDQAEKIRFLSTIEPALVRKATDFYGRRFPATQTTKVDGIRRVGVQELVDIQTSSGTFIAAGLATHNCYALTLAKRLKSMGNPRYQRDGNPRASGPGFGLTVHEDKLNEPLGWRKPRRIFVNSMSDLFHSLVPTGFIYQVFEVMQQASHHQFQVLTKRPRRMATVVNAWYRETGLEPLPNVWLGTSVENQEWADRRIPLLATTSAAIRFLSCEPLLGPIRVSHASGIHWVIVGGESGPSARPMSPDWVRGLRDQCVAGGVPFFFKQWGGRTPKAGGRVLDGRTWDEMPVPLMSDVASAL